VTETFSPVLVLAPGGHREAAMAAAEIRSVLHGQGFAIAPHDSHAAPRLTGVGAVIIGAPIIQGRWHDAARAFLLEHRTALMEKPVAVFGLSDDAHAVMDRHELIHEMSHYRWLHPIAADVFHVQATTSGHQESSTTSQTDAIDLDAVRSWAHLVMHLLTPTGTRALTS
jgi:menaquinone-dependent protoporphyrinogen IX oxidase